MKIVINDEAIDFTLQGEDELGEIVPAIEEWLNASQYTISAIAADGKELSMEETESWRRFPLTEIGTLTVQASSRIQQRLDSIETAVELLALLRRVVELGDSAQLAEAMVEYEYLREALPSLISHRLQEGEEARNYLDTLLEESGIRSGSRPGGDQGVREVTRGIDSVISMLQGRAREILDPEEEFRSVARAVAASLASVEEVPVLLQTGEGDDAMRRLAGFTGLLERLLRLHAARGEDGTASEQIAGTGSSASAPESGEGHPSGEIVEGLNEVLQELIDALNDEDTVLVGDLVEYEVVPKMEEFLRAHEVERPEKQESDG